MQNTNDNKSVSTILGVLGTLFVLFFIAVPLWAIALKEGHDFIVHRHALRNAVVQPASAPSINVTVGSNGCCGCCNNNNPCGCHAPCEHVEQPSPAPCGQQQ